jgi:hypothetical protein
MHYFEDSYSSDNTYSDGYDNLIAGVIKVASEDYIKARRTYIKEMIFAREERFKKRCRDKFEKELSIYKQVIENWSVYDYVTPEYMVRKCNEIVDSGIKRIKGKNYIHHI